MDRQFKKQTDQSAFSSFSSSLLSVTMLTPFMVFTCFLIFGFSLPFLTITFLILSTSILLISAKNRRLCSSAHNPAPVNHPLPEAQVAKKSQLTAVAETIDEDPESEFVNREAQNKLQLQNQFSGSGGYVESQNLGLKWLTPDEEEEDDELIEIELHGCCYKNDDLILNEEAKQVTFGEYMAAEAILKQKYLIELFAEMNEGNEEENLIEIDISMGFIKCPSFEIQA